MDQLTEIFSENCILCSSTFSLDSFQSKINDKEPQIILNELLQLWSFAGWSPPQTNLLNDHFSKDDSASFCPNCRSKIEEYEVLIQKVRTRVSEFEKQFKIVLKYLESENVGEPVSERGRKNLRNKAKSKELEQDTEEINQHEQEDFVERGSCLVNVRPEVFERLQVCDDDERADTFADVLRDVFPNCALRFGGLEATCKIKSCKLMIRITLSEDQQSQTKLLHILLNGDPNHSETEDSDRRIFEMSKMDFLEEKICEFCCSRFQDENSWTNHRLKVETDFVCPKCDQKFKTFQLRNNHFLSQHTSDAPYKCEKCSKCFKTATKCSEHEKICLDETRFSCNLCQKTFSSVRNLDNHVQVVHLKTESKWSFQCPHCSKRFYKNNNLKNHLLCHEKEKKLICDVDGCGKRFKRRKALDAHLMRLHRGQKECHLCPICGKNFASLSGIKLHMAKHTGNEYIKRTSVCGTCGKSFRCKADLETHLVVHSKEKPHSCNICNMSFTQKSSLKDHLNVHWNTFQCSKCKKSFGRQRYLDQHEKGCGNVDVDTSQNVVSRNDNMIQNVVDQTLIVADTTPSIITTSNDVQCVIIGNEKLHLIPSGDGTFVVSDGADVVRGTNVLAHFNESGNIAMLEYTDQH